MAALVLRITAVEERLDAIDRRVEPHEPALEENTTHFITEFWREEE